MFNNIFEILFIISSLGILFKICNHQYINYPFIISILSFILMTTLILTNNHYNEKFTLLGGKKTAKKTPKKTRKELLNECGLPDTGNTGHCFNDSTHHTCCMLGPKARAYADRSGNPIGKASIKAYKAKTKKSPKNKDLTPWCTCTGSEVCSYYANKFKDGTYIKFINNPSLNQNTYKDDLISEKKFKELAGIQSHRTPGIV